MNPASILIVELFNSNKHVTLSLQPSQICQIGADIKISNIMLQHKLQMDKDPSAKTSKIKVTAHCAYLSNMYNRYTINTTYYSYHPQRNILRIVMCHVCVK